MDTETQCRYVKSLKSTLNVNEESTVFSKYMNNIRNALIAGILSEYLVNGNASKPMGIIAKTLIYSSLSTMTALD